jgi:hypothetical protein
MSKAEQSELKLKTFEQLKNECQYFFGDNKEEKTLTALTKKLAETDKSINLENQILRKEVGKILSDLKEKGLELSEGFDSISFDSLSEMEKINLTKNVFGILAQENYFSLSARTFAPDAQTYILENEVIDSFPEKARLEIAYEIVKNKGGLFFNEINFLTDTQKLELVQMVKKGVKSWLPLVPDELIEKLVEEKNRVELHYLIYQRFSGEFFLKPYSLSPKPVFQKLKSFLEESNFDLVECAKIFKLAMIEQEKYFQNDGWAKWPHAVSTKYPRWLGQKDPEKSVPITIAHGGGFFHILEFLSGKSKGYLSDDAEHYGMYVSPDSASRNSHYAHRTAPYHLDIPAQFFAQIESKHLINTQNYSYEAIINSYSVSHFNNFSLNLYRHFDYLEKLKTSKPEQSLKIEPASISQPDESSLVQMSVFKTKSSSTGEKAQLSDKSHDQNNDCDATKHPC